MPVNRNRTFKRIALLSFGLACIVPCYDAYYTISSAHHILPAILIAAADFLSDLTSPLALFLILVGGLSLWYGKKRTASPEKEGDATGSGSS